jgi:peptidoglycan/xylan/chitin deacetylase (PgdA/CDA1 family)
MGRHSIYLITAVAVLGIVLAGAGLTSMAAPTESAEPPAVTAELPTAVPTTVPTIPPTPTPTSTPQPTLTPTPTPAPPTVTPTPTLHPDIALYAPHEQGDVLVLVYHRIDRPEDRWTRTPENLRKDLDCLVTHGYYPVNLIDLATGNLDHVPRGRRPIVLTFDDSTRGHFQYLEDSTVDPDCAVGILLAMHEEYGEDWPLRATFFVLLSDADEPGYALFRQPESAAQKLQALVDWGFEVGSHTIHHPTLSELSDERVAWELAVSKSRIESLIPEYEVRSLALPYGVYPKDISLVKEGYSASAEASYRYDAVVRLGSAVSSSPFAEGFDPYHIPRIQAIQSQLDLRLAYYEHHPELYYVSDGGAD